MVDKNIIQSRFTKLGVVPIDNQHYLYATLDNNLIGIIVFIKTCDKHYYDEDDIEVGKAVNCGVIVNHRVELSPEEQAEARENALKAYQNEELRKIQQRNSKPKPTPKAVRQEPEQPTLFDLGL